MDREEVIRYIAETYGAAPEYLWSDSPDACIFRHSDNRKWFAIIQNVPRSKLGLPGEGSADLLNTKCGPLLSGSYLGKPGIKPAWHMNKTHWIGALLDGTAAEADIRELLDLSFSLTDRRK
jgi:predicted DNA-binding protein (MmcQ/YjbR family)